MIQKLGPAEPRAPIAPSAGPAARVATVPAGRLGYRPAGTVPIPRIASEAQAMVADQASVGSARERILEAAERVVETSAQRV